MNHIWVALVALGSGCAAITAILVLGRRIAVIARKVVDFLDDWKGEPARPGFDRRPGVMEKISDLDRGQLHIIDRLTSVESEVRAYRARR